MTDTNYYGNLVSMMNTEEMQSFNEIMSTADSLKAREEQARIQCEKLEDSKKQAK